jgi:hypothetical protein
MASRFPRSRANGVAVASRRCPPWKKGVASFGVTLAVAKAGAVDTRSRAQGRLARQCQRRAIPAAGTDHDACLALPDSGAPDDREHWS